MAGILYLVATPIGNLSDLTPRVKSTLESVDLILAEDTRVTIKLLNHMGIKKRMLSCHDFNEKSRLSLISQYAALNQKIALVSDAGTPLISDPGSEIVRQAINYGMNVIPIPGASAFLLALIASGLPCDRFVFEGFLPSKPSLSKQRLEKLQLEERTIIIYEAPHRLLKTLTAISNIFGDREICLARELTKKFEEIIRGKISKILIDLEHDTISSINLNQTISQSKSSKKVTRIIGEYVIVIAGNQTIEDSLYINQKDLKAAIKQMLVKGVTLKTSVKDITEKYKLKRSEVYELALEIQKEL